MQNQKGISTLAGILTIIVAAVIIFGGVFVYEFFATKTSQVIQTQQNWKIYTNNQYGFSLNFPDSWKGYSVEKQTWEGQSIDNYAKKYTGALIVIKNPQTTKSQAWQDIPIMVFTPAQWQMVSGPNPTVAVSAAPIGPAKIGENSKYVFATPPRWYGFTDAIGFDEAVNIVKTFKTFNFTK